VLGYITIYGGFMAKSELFQNLTDLDLAREYLAKYPQFKDDILKATIPKATIYEYMYNCNKKRGNDTAITFRIVKDNVMPNGKVKTFKTRTRTISYDELHDKIAEYSKIFSSLNLNVQDRVGMLMPNLPESTFLIYGANKFGVVPDHIDPTSQPNNLKEYIKREHVKTLVCFDLLYNSTIKPIERYLKEELGIQNVIIVSITDSLIFPDKQLLELMARKKEPLRSDVLNLIPLNRALKDSRYNIGVTHNYEPNELANICHSSGTTGFPKPMPVTNENMNFMHVEHVLDNLDNPNIKTTLHILPAFAQFGLTDAMHTWHCLGKNLITIPEFKQDDIVSLLVEYEPNCVYGTPNWWLNMAENPKYSNINLSFLYEAVVGGDKLLISQIQKINEFLITHGAHCLIRAGYGLSEFGGDCIIADPFRTPADSCGKVLTGGEAKIINMETKKECPNDEEGMLLFRKTSMPPKEFDGKPLFNRTTFENQEYVITGDIMTKDNNDNYYFKTRESGMICRYDGCKIIPTKLENIISAHPLVKDCMVSGYYEPSRYGNMPFAKIILDKEYSPEDEEIIIRDIVDNYILANSDLTFRWIPSRWGIVQELPITHGLKKDYGSLSKEGPSKDDIKLIASETNIGLENYSLEFPRENEKKYVLEKK
jgi:acyl-CoA synthetase (AMP-forming)/AMP-acid ligase II